MSQPTHQAHNEYDYIFAGGGAAGLSLALRLVGNPDANQPSRQPRMLIIDRDPKDRNDRTWCFWSANASPLDHLVYHTWERVEFISDHFRQVYDLAPYRYQMIRGIDFYQGARSSLQGIPGVEFLTGRVEKVEDAAGVTQVRVNRRAYLGRWVFDSLFTPSNYFQGPPGYHYLKQHFKGWEIETPVDTFDPGVATLFDFRTPQKGAMRFFYVLPFTKRKALVEYTSFSCDLSKPNEYDRALSEYLEHVLCIPSYRIAGVENGIIPMTDQPFPRRLAAHRMAIGTKGGRVKPSTGYAFLRIQQDSAAIVQSLAELGHPFGVPASPWRYRLFDTLMLQVMYRQGDRLKDIFTALFQHNSIQNIFRFLDETASPAENLRLIASLPSLPFLQALFRVKLMRRI